MMKRTLICLLMALVSVVTSVKIPGGIAESMESGYRLTHTLVETGRDNGFSKENQVEKSNPHYGWNIGNFSVSGFVAKEVAPFGVPIFYVRKGDINFKLIFELNYPLDKLGNKETLSVNEDTNGYDTSFEIEKQDFGYGALFIRRRDIETGEYDEVSKHLNFLYGRKVGSQFVVTNSMVEGDYEIALDYEIKERYGLLNALTNWWNYKMSCRFAVRYFDEEGSLPKATNINTSQIVVHSENNQKYKLEVRSNWFEEAKQVGENIGVDGSQIEYFSDESENTMVTMIASPQDGNIKKPYLNDDTQMKDYIESLALNQYVETSADENSLCFQYEAEGHKMYAQAKAYWTDHFVMIVIAENADKQIDAEWIDTLIVKETAIAEGVDLQVPDSLNNVWEIWASNGLTIQKLFAEEDMLTTVEPFQHGFAAEHASMLVGHIRGIFTGERIQYTGGDKKLNGPDFTIKAPNGTITFIQAKYYKTATDSIDACFDANNNFKYLYSDGTPMCIEVPKDQYSEALNRMRTHIQEGHLNEITDPNKAEEIVRQGTITYKQAVNIAKAGTVESLTYDAVHGCVAASSALGISVLVELAVGCWNGEPLDEAITRSIFTGLEVGGKAFIVTVVSSQLSKTALSRAMIPTSKAIVNALGTKAAQVFVNAFRPAGMAIYGAAAKQAAQKLLRGNTITAAVSLVVFSVPDIVDAFRGRISVKQLIKNTATATGGIAGAAGGAWVGAAAGSAILPGPGTAIGGFLGGLVGGLGLSIGVGALADLIAEDDANEMIEIISSEYARLAEEYLLSAEEGERVSVLLQRKITGAFLKELFSSKNRELKAAELIEPMIAEEAANREIVPLPEIKTYSDALIMVLENIEEEIN